MKKQRIVFLVYALFLGWTGVHRHYLGQHRIALLYPLVFILVLLAMVFGGWYTWWAQYGSPYFWGQYILGEWAVVLEWIDLLETTMLVASLIPIIEVVFYSLKGDEEFDAVYNR